ncbi:MAG: histidine kinase [Candidatus Sedimenticola sp. PURPLELP]
MASEKKNIYGLMRFYGLASLLATVLVAFFILFYYRQLAVSTIVETSKESNIALSQATASSLKNHLSEYIWQLEQDRRRGVEDPTEVPEDLAAAIRNLMVETAVVRVKIYDRLGAVVYSTTPSQIGDDGRRNPGFISASHGNPFSKLSYYDQFNFWESKTSDDNFVHSYVPIRVKSSAPVIGVLELYTDVNRLVSGIERNEFAMHSVVLILMGVLYGTLLFVVKRSEWMLEKQHQKDRERQQTMEMLSSKMLTFQEDQRKHIAHELHEEIVQTLSAVKLGIETTLAAQKDERRRGYVNSQKMVISNLQDAINRARAMVMELRPPSLEDFGLGVAVGSVLKECSELDDRISISSKIEVDELEISQDRKSIIYRIVKETLSSLYLNEGLAGELQLSLNHSGSGVTLVMKIDGGFTGNAEVNSENVIQLTEFDQMKERTLLSGGDFSTEEEAHGIIAYKAHWGS